MVAYLDDDNPELVDFSVLIKNLKRSRIHRAIFINPLIYKIQMNTFWHTAKLVKGGNEEIIEAEISGEKIVVSESILRDLLKFKDSAEDPISVSSSLIRKCCLLMKYQGPDASTLRKNFFSSSVEISLSYSYSLSE